MLLAWSIDPSPKWPPKIQIGYNYLKLKTCASTRKSIFTLVNLQSFSFSGMHYTPSHTNVCQFFSFQLTFFQLILHLKSWNFAGLLNLKVFFLALLYVFNFALFEFSAAILEKGLLLPLRIKKKQLVPKGVLSWLPEGTKHFLDI